MGQVITSTAWGQPYELVRRYYRHTGCMAAFASAMVEKAKRDNAPADAVHFHGGRWYTAKDIKNPDTRRAIGLPPLPTKGE